MMISANSIALPEGAMIVGAIGMVDGAKQLQIAAVDSATIEFQDMFDFLPVERQTQAGFNRRSSGLSHRLNDNDYGM